MFKKLISLLFLVFIVYKIFSFTVYAEESVASPRKYMGQKWYNTPRNIEFRCDFPYEEREAVRGAMAKWNSVKTPSGDSMVTMFVTQIGNPGNSITYSSSWYQWIGYCEKVTTGDQILSVNVKLANEVDWSVGGSPGKYDIQTIVQHELGHALGVAHCHESSEGVGPCASATCLSNVMYPFVETGKVNTTLKEYDTASYIVIYW